MAMHRIKRRAGILVLRKLGMRFCRTRLLSRGTHVGRRMGVALDFRCKLSVEGGRSEYTRVEAPVLKDCASVLLAVNHFSYSAAILLLSQDVIYVGAWSRWCKLGDVNGAQGCPAVV